MNATVPFNPVLVTENWSHVFAGQVDETRVRWVGHPQVGLLEAQAQNGPLWEPLNLDEKEDLAQALNADRVWDHIAAYEEEGLSWRAWPTWA